MTESNSDAAKARQDLDSALSSIEGAATVLAEMVGDDEPIGAALYYMSKRLMEHHAAASEALDRLYNLSARPELVPA